MTTATEYLTAAQTTKLIRAAVKAAFPGQRFSVRIRSGRSSATVSWTDGPTEAAVTAVVQTFAGGRFDGMTDCMDYVTSTLEDGTTFQSGCDFVFTDRDVSVETADAIKAHVAEVTGVEYDSANRAMFDVYEGKIMASHYTQNFVTTLGRSLFAQTTYGTMSAQQERGNLGS